MALCEQCGSIQIVRAKRKPTDKLLAIFTSKRRFVCRRCGWCARRDWTDEDLRALLEYGAGGAQPDPSLAVLDGRHKDRTRTSEQKADRKPKEFHLAALDLEAAGPIEDGDAAAASVAGKRPGVRRRRKRSKRRVRSRAIAAAVAVTALVTLLVVMVGLTGSCTNGPMP